ncbi:MAG: 3'-5' exonuclease [Candidatus Latescibacterota bacterium]|nr:3'-5' exonuclease [Candidatus Latescibacterota bacterium]
MAIGDPDQAIYGFRGAEPAYFARLREDFPDARLFRLGSNYRSQGAIVEAAAAVIGHNSDREEIALAAVRPGSGPIRLIAVSGETAEGVAVVREIGRMVGGVDMMQADAGSGGTRSFADFAVLFRTGRQGRILAECFEQEGLPYRLVGQKAFLQSSSVRAALAFARYALDPQEGLRLLHAQEAIGATDESGELAALVTEYGQLAAGAGAGAWVRRWRAQFGDSGDEELAQLERMAGVAGTLGRLLETVLLGSEADYEQRGGPQGSEAVSLMTLHAAKGLEFPVVFVCGVEDGLVPLRERGADLAEERRLFYVGMTRAEEELVLLRARSRQRYGERVEVGVSPFVGEIPGGLVEREVVEKKKKVAVEQLSLF